MTARGVHFALTADEAARLAPERRTDDDVLALVDELEERWDEEWCQETDKAWDAIHRCLTDGTLRPGNTALHKCILGTADAYGGGDYLVNFLTPPEVREVAAAIKRLDAAWLREHYFRIPAQDYGVPLDEEDFAYTWEWFARLQAFYQRAAAQGRAVLFTADQ